MTPAEIDALPNPPFRPARDMMLCERIAKSFGGLHIPDEAADRIQVCRVLVTGPGIRLDDGFHRCAPHARGDRIFITPTDGYPITLDGEVYWIVEANEVMGELLDESTLAFGRDEI